MEDAARRLLNLLPLQQSRPVVLSELHILFEQLTDVAHFRLE
jgi:hypothetical protein